MERRLKVLMSAYACEPGRGSEPEVGWQWATQMARLHDVTVITRANNRAAIEAALASLPPPHPQFAYFDLSNRFLAWKKRGLPVSLYYFFWQFAAAREFAPSLARFDLVHHTTFNSFRQPGAWRVCGRPIVLGPLGGGQICPWRLMGDFGTSVPTELLRSTTVRLNALNPFAQRSFRDASIILCANQDTADRVPSRFKSKVRMMLETGISQPSTTAVPHRTDQKRLRVIWVSRLVPIKGALLALRAFALAHQQFPGLVLTLVGDGPDTQATRALATELGLANAVEWTGKVSLDAVKSLLPQQDIFLFTSLRDTSGNVLLEAMAAGLPAVTLRHHGAAQIATDETAVRIPPAAAKTTIRQLADALVMLAKDGERRTRMGTAAIQRINELYLWPRKAEAMTEVYAEAIHRSPRTA